MMTKEDVDRFGELYPDFICIDCGCCTVLEYYMLYDDLWKRVNQKIEGMLCIGCCEIRLGRILTKIDFIDAPINYPNGFNKSERFMDRLTR